MNRLSPVLLILLPIAPFLRADPVVGSTRESVLEELGSPRSRMAVGDYEVMTYSRGSVTIENGVVTKLNLLSDEEWRRRENSRFTAMRARSEAEAKEAARIAALRREDREALTDLLAAPEWAAATPEQRLARLDRFAVAHPYADTGTLRAATEARRENAEERRARLQELEQRVAAAESRAGEAESRARTAELTAVSASADADNARRAAAEAAARANRVDGGVVAYSYIGGRTWTGYDSYSRDNRGATVVVRDGGTVITNGGVTVIRPQVREVVRPAAPTPGTVRPTSPTAARPGVGKSGPPSSQKR